MRIGRISTTIGKYFLPVEIATQSEDGYWECEYKKYYIVSESLSKLKNIKVGMQYFGNYWGNIK